MSICVHSWLDFRFWGPSGSICVDLRSDFSVFGAGKELSGPRSGLKRRKTAERRSAYPGRAVFEVVQSILGPFLVVFPIFGRFGGISRDLWRMGTLAGLLRRLRLLR